MDKIIETNQSVEEMHHLFVVLARQFGLLQKESSQCCGITTIQSHILYEIKCAPNLSLNELAEKLSLDNSTISRHIHDLVNKELVLRQPDSNDRRFVTLDLTDQGVTLEKEVSNMIVAWILDILSYLPEDKINSTFSELKLLSEALNKSKYCCQPPII
ncbi:MAG TPA: MarR family winged helix-turn-helix transcriptional regulator [Aliicoccus persicus]|uniref:MarR family winged helix-turn-helix transcriptional regulator n=1 Tax=Aliicoccus persicus TaxID=930138 RepID=A0A921B5S9_9STAP|nr:MarR family winged helix-turn-helix transcriptional regulator [Aliicoccus persicus]